MLVPILDLIIEVAADQGGRQVVLGMAHRGRLNVLAHTVGIGYEDILREFEGIHGEGALHVPGTGDVKYHHGAEGVRTLADGRSMVVTLAPNPSHLEFVNPVVLGMTRSLQFGDEGREAVQDWSAVIPVLIHGDAAFAAEGVVAETLNLGRLEGYRVGGALHVIVNNQVGFTTDPEDGRSTHYASGLAKGYDVPIIHVNADRPAACLAAVRLAMAYRAQYHDDILIDLVGYRRYGHNEGDEPAYTQPKLYKVIASHPTVRSLWADDLVRDGVLTAEDDHRLQEAVLEHLRDRQDRIAAQIEAEPGDGSAGADGGGGGGVDGAIGVDGVGAADGEDIGEGEAGGARDGEDIGEGIGEAEAAPDGSPPAPEELDTRVSFDTLAEVNRAAFSWPEAFQVHPKLSRQLERRRDGVEEEARLDWGHAETLAFGTILREGFVIRLTGQDVQRGTFSHRHVVLHDVETGEEHTPLHDVGDGRFEIYNSPLSEAAVLGYEYGYSVAAERDLILWEAQFGDFVNAAQVAIDQFVASGREKWNQLSNLTLLLPHGYEGQGPEHSSARLERFLQLCAEGNIRVAYPTTPAQQFHLLRRQAHARPEVPLVVMTPKSLLRLPAAASPVSDLVNGGFRAVLDDPSAEERRDVVTRLVLCTGKVYYDLQASPARADMDHVAIARLEELYPFPAGDLETLAASYPKLHEVVWAQEEPRNMGGLTFVGPRLRSVIPRKVNLSYVARPERASPAEGMNTDHHTEQARIVAEALGVR
jgi:2-oxoglutarate dehydrogenase E1 component